MKIGRIRLSLMAFLTLTSLQIQAINQDLLEKEVRELTYNVLKKSAYFAQDFGIRANNSFELMANYVQTKASRKELAGYSALAIIFSIYATYKFTNWICTFNDSDSKEKSRASQSKLQHAPMNFNSLSILILSFLITSNISCTTLDAISAAQLKAASSSVNFSKTEYNWASLLPINSILSLDLSTFKELINSILAYAQTLPGELKVKCLSLVSFLKQKKAEVDFNSAWNHSNSSVQHAPSIHIEGNMSSISEYLNSSLRKAGSVLGNIKWKLGGVVGAYLAYKTLKYAYGTIKNRFWPSSKTSGKDNQNINLNVNVAGRDEEGIKEEVLRQLNEIFRNIRA